MNIPEAIKILERDIKDPGSVAIEDINEAEQLGIEALDFKHWWSKGTYFPSTFLLKGETKE